MPRAGRYDYPVRPLDDMTAYVKKTREVAGEVAKREVVADALGMAVRGGGFALVASAMQNYGLVETGGGQIKVTDLGKRVAYETEPKLLEQAKAEAVSRVDMFRDYYAQYGTDVTEEKVKVFLRAKAQADVAEIGRIAPGISKLLKSNLHYLTGVHVEGVGGEVGRTEAMQPWDATRRSDRQSGGGTGTVTTVDDNLIEFRMGSSLVRFPMSEIETAYEVIPALLKKKLKAAQETREASVKEEKE